MGKEKEIIIKKTFKQYKLKSIGRIIKKKLSDKDNFLTAGYVYLKNLTNSFKNEGKDV